MKVGTITIVGNKAFSDRRIIRTMRNDRPYSIPLYITYIPVLSKTFDRPKLDEDMEVGIRGLYQDNGYFKVDVNVPDLKTRGSEPRAVCRLPVPGIGRKKGKATNITIRIDEGEQYHMGKLVVPQRRSGSGTGLQAGLSGASLPVEGRRPFFATKIRKALDNYKKLYGEYGYIDFVATPDHRAGRHEEDRQHDDGIRPAKAVLRAAHRIFGKHHDARQGNPPRTAAG